MNCAGPRWMTDRGWTANDFELKGRWTVLPQTSGWMYIHCVQSALCAGCVTGQNKRNSENSRVVLHSRTVVQCSVIALGYYVLRFSAYGRKQNWLVVAIVVFDQVEGLKGICITYVTKQFAQVESTEACMYVCIVRQHTEIYRSVTPTDARRRPELVCSMSLITGRSDISWVGFTFRLWSSASDVSVHSIG